MVKKLKWNLIFMSLLYVGLGLFLVMKPGTALNIVCYALGGVVLACAAVQLIRYFVVERGVFQSQLTLISGLVCLALSDSPSCSGVSRFWHPASKSPESRSTAKSSFFAQRLHAKPLQLCLICFIVPPARQCSLTESAA